MKPVENDLSKKEMILKVTLDLINSEGLEGVTVRKIASVADVNVALINYYFGSKDKLLNAATQVLISSFKKSFDFLNDTSLEPRERLKNFLISYSYAHQQYPFIIRRLINDEPNMFDNYFDFTQFIKSIGLENLQKTIEELSGENDPEMITTITSHILGAAFLPTLVEPLYKKITGYSLPDIEKRIDILLDRYFAN